MNTLLDVRAYNKMISIFIHLWEILKYNEPFERPSILEIKLVDPASLSLNCTSKFQ